MLHLVSSEGRVDPDAFADAGLTVIQSGDAMNMLWHVLVAMTFAQVHSWTIERQVKRARHYAFARAKAAQEGEEEQTRADEIDLADDPDPQADVNTVILTAAQIADATALAAIELSLLGIDDDCE